MMRVLLLATEYPDALGTLTENTPKALLKIGKRTILDWLCDDLENLVEEYVIVTKKRYVPAFLEWARTKDEPVIVIEDGISRTKETKGRGEVLNVSYAIEQAKLHHDLLVIKADGILDYSLYWFARYCQDAGTSCILRHFEEDIIKLMESGVVQTDENDRVLDFEDRPKEPATHWSTLPFYFFRAEDLDLLPRAIAGGTCNVSSLNSLVEWMRKRSEMHAMEYPGKWWETESEYDLEKAKREFDGMEWEKYENVISPKPFSRF